MFDIKEVKKKAQEEYREERMKEATKKIKAKMKELDNAKLIVRNLERELQDLEIELTQ